MGPPGGGGKGVLAYYYHNQNRGKRGVDGQGKTWTRNPRSGEGEVTSRFHNRPERPVIYISINGGRMFPSLSKKRK